MHGAHVSCTTVAPAEVASGGVACGARLLCLLIMRRCGWRPILVLTGHVGSKRGRNKEEKTKLPFPCCTSRGRRRRNNAA